MDCSIGINGLKLDLFYSARSIASFFNYFFGSCTDSGECVVDVVIEDRVSLVISIRDSEELVQSELG